MLTATKQLIHQFSLLNPNHALLQPLLQCVVKYGAAADAGALLPVYLAHPDDYNRSALNTLFARVGNAAMAQQLYNGSVNGHRLLPNVNAEVLTTLGALQYAAALPTLVYYGITHPGIDYYNHRAAVLGLLHHDCIEHLPHIEKGIENCYGKNLFAEYLPALVCKLPNRQQYFEPMYQLGSQYASTDCNAGLLLGFALSGADGKPWFKQALFNPAWEAWLTSTGTLQAAYKALKMAGITLAELFAETHSAPNHQQAYHVTILLALLEQRLADYNDDHIDSFYSIAQNLCNDSDGNSLTMLAAQYGLEEQAAELVEKLEMRTTGEMMIKLVAEKDSF